MAQKHYRQHGTFHITTNAEGKMNWCTEEGIPKMLIDNLMMTRSVQNAKVFAFCILPDHVHIILSPGEKGLSSFMHSFKRNSSKDIRHFLMGQDSSGNRTRATATGRQPENATLSAPTVLRSQGSVTLAPQNEFSGWQNGFHDERIRSSDQRSNALSYVKYNSFRHHLVGGIEDWPWTSLKYEHLLDDMDIWFDSPFDPF